MKKLLLILLIINLTVILKSQELLKQKRAEKSCYTILSEARKDYNDGMYLDCISKLNGILKTCDFVKKEKEIVLELLAKAYIETGRIPEADEIINSLLLNNPHYELKEAENPEDFNRIVRMYNIHPLLTIGARNTADWVNYKTTEVYKVLNGLDYNRPYSKYKYGILEGFGFMYYGFGELEFNHGISLNGEFTFWWNKFNREFTNPPGFSLSYWETDNYLEIPIYVKKYFPVTKNLLSYITAGVGWNYMTSASGNITISYTAADVITGKNSDYSAYNYNMDMIGLRNRHTFEWIAGAGLGYKIKNLRIFLDARYYGGINSFTNPEKGLLNTQLTDEFFYVDNSVHLTQFEVGLSIGYTLFNSVKRRR